MKRPTYQWIFLNLVVVSVLVYVGFYWLIIKNRLFEKIYALYGEQVKYFNPNEPFLTFFHSNSIASNWPDINLNCSVYQRTKQVTVKFSDGENLSFYPRKVPLHMNKSINHKCLARKVNQTSFRILLWNEIFRIDDLISFRNYQCPIRNCQFTINKYKYEQSDLVLFNLNHPSVRYPVKRDPNQLWAYMIYEPLSVLPARESDFNWSVTYASDSDFVSYHYRSANLEWNKHPTEKKHSINSHLMATIVDEDHCTNDILRFVSYLSTYVQMDVFGKCGINFNGTYDECLDHIGANYKFFFVYQRPTCTDYVSDTFFRLIKYDIVPVVFKQSNHNLYIPREGFIQADRFESINSLADYLNYLALNRTAYRAYFNWKRFVSFTDYKREGLNPIESVFCDLCLRLNLNKLSATGQYFESAPVNFSKYLSKKNCFTVKISDVQVFTYSNPYVEIVEKSFWQKILDFIGF